MDRGAQASHDRTSPASEDPAAGVLGALTAVVLAAPAAADACPSFAKVPAFRGTASASFNQTASYSSSGYTETVTLDRVADGLRFHKLVPQSFGHGMVTFTGPPEGGSVSVNDGYHAARRSDIRMRGRPGIGFAPAQFGCR